MKVAVENEMYIGVLLVAIVGLGASSSSSAPSFAASPSSSSSSIAGAAAFFSSPPIPHRRRRRRRPVVVRSLSSRHSRESRIDGTPPESETERDGDGDYDDDATTTTRRIVVRGVSLDDADGLEEMSRFCIDAFYGRDEGEGGKEGSSLLSRKWRDVRLGALRRAQLLDISLSRENRRCIFVAKDAASRNPDEIVGCCEVTEERLAVAPPPPPPSTSANVLASTERERRKTTARPRPVIENLYVRPNYRRYGAGQALARACEEAVRREWQPGYDEVFAQVREDNLPARGFFEGCGYDLLFADPTCAEVVLDDAFFAKEVTVTKRMMRKFLPPPT